MTRLHSLGDALAPSTMVVLAGGSNSRLGSLSGTIYKPFLPVNGMTMVAKHLLRAGLSGIKRVIVVTDEHDPLVTRYLNELADNAAVPEITQLYVPGEMEAKTLASASEAGSTGPLPLVLGDSFALYDPLELIAAAESDGVDSAMAVASFRVPYGVIDVADGLVHRFEEKPLSPYLVNTGQIAVGPRLLEELGRGSRLPGALDALARDGDLAAVRLQSSLMTIDSLHDLAKLNAGLEAAGELPERRAAAVVIYDDSGRFLTVKRPPANDALAGVWGLPAVDMLAGETWEAAARRVGRQKLGIDLEIVEKIGDERVQRNSYILHLTEFRARIVAGQPSVPQADQSITQYVDLAYTDDPAILIDAARRGSACSRILLRCAGVPWHD